MSRTTVGEGLSVEILSASAKDQSLMWAAPRLVPLTAVHESEGGTFAAKFEKSDFPKVTGMFNYSGLLIS